MRMPFAVTAMHPSSDARESFGVGVGWAMGPQGLPGLPGDGDPELNWVK